MAFPTIRSSANGVLSTADLNVTITLPTGHIQGDLLIIGLALDGNREITAPAGLNLLANPTNYTTVRFPIWWKIRGASESNPTLTWITTTEIGTWFSIAITKGTWSGIPEITTAAGSSANPNAPSLTPSWGSGDTLWFALHGWDYNRTSSTNPTNFTLLTYQAGSSTASAGHRTHHRSVAASNQDPTQITISATDEWYAHTLAIKWYEPPNIQVNIGGAYKQVEEVYVNIDGTWRLASDYSVNIAGVWKSVNTKVVVNGTVWTYIGTTGTPNGTQDYIHPSSICPTSNQTQTWLTSNYPANGYELGYIMRVRNYTEDFAGCVNDYYFRCD